MKSIKPCTISNVLEQGPVVLPIGHTVYSGPAVLTVVLQTGHTATEEWSWLVVALNPVAFVTHLAIQYVGLDLNLRKVKLLRSVVRFDDQHILTFLSRLPWLSCMKRADTAVM